jgi:hypothetical protein
MNTETTLHRIAENELERIEKVTSRDFGPLREMILLQLELTMREIFEAGQHFKSAPQQ